MTHRYANVSVRTRLRDCSPLRFGGDAAITSDVGRTDKEMLKKTKWLTALLLAMSMGAAACSGSDTDASSGSTETEDSTEVEAEESSTTEGDSTEGDSEPAASGDAVTVTLSIDLQGGNQEAVMTELIEAFEVENPNVNVEIETTSYQQVLEQLPLLLESGDAPDLMRLTNYNLREYFLDLSPYVDADYWAANMARTTTLLSQDGVSPAGMFLDVTVTGPYINRTLFEQAGVDVPSDSSDEVTWEEWAVASRAVAEATGTPFAMAMDRSGHRFAGPAISMGAEYFDAEGNPSLIGDKGFKAMAELFLSWHEDGTMPLDVWAGGDSYQDAGAEFTNANLVFHMSGNWQIGNYADTIQDAFDWSAVPPPCGPGGCTGMPGGSVLVGYSETEHPAEVAAFIDFLAREDNYRTWAESNLLIPQHDGLVAAGLDFSSAPEAAQAALTTFAESAANVSPVAGDLLGYEFSGPVFNGVRDRLTQAIVGELTLDEAIERMQSDIDTAIEGSS